MVGEFGNHFQLLALCWLLPRIYLSMSVIPVSALAAFFEDEHKLLRKGENALKSSRLESFSFCAEPAHVLAKVKASMKDKTYTVEVSTFVWCLVGTVPDGFYVRRFRMRVTKAQCIFTTSQDRCSLFINLIINCYSF